MPATCCVRTCNNNASNTPNSDISFHRFPKDPDIRAKWIEFCGEGAMKLSSRICSVHFKKDDLVRDLQNELLGKPLKNRLKKGACPIASTHNHDDNGWINTSAYIVENIFKDLEKKEDMRRTEVQKIFEEYSESLQNVQTDPRTDCSPEPETLNDITEKNVQNYKDMYEKLLYHYKTLQMEYNKLKEENVLQRKELESREAKIEYYKCKANKIEEKEKKISDILSQVLTENQIKLLSHEKKRVNWSPTDMSVAFTLRFYSKKSYIFLKEKLNYPLPGLSSLRRWAMNIDMRQGVLNNILNFMKLTGEDLSDMERCVILQFDEVKVHSVVEYDPVSDEIIGPFSQMQVVMARGLFGKWKQPIFVDFDKKMTKKLLMDIIIKLHEINYTVVACVSDCGASNIGLWKLFFIKVLQI